MSMQINISGHHLQVTDALRDLIHRKCRKLSRHHDQLHRLEIILSVEKERHRAEAHLQMGGAPISAAAESRDMYSAIDGMLEKLDRQLEKRKQPWKVQEHRQAESRF